MLEAALKKMRALLPEYVKTNVDDQDPVCRFIDYIDSKMVTGEDVVHCKLSDTSLFKLQVLLDEQLLSTKLAVSDRKKEVKNKCLIEVFHILIYQSGIFITDY